MPLGQSSKPATGSPVEDEAPARAHFGGRHVDSEASIGQRDNEKQLH